MATLRSSRALHFNYTFSNFYFTQLNRFLGCFHPLFFLAGQAYHFLAVLPNVFPLNCCQNVTHKHTHTHLHRGTEKGRVVDFGVGQKRKPGRKMKLDGPTTRNKCQMEFQFGCDTVGYHHQDSVLDLKARKMSDRWIQRYRWLCRSPWNGATNSTLLNPAKYSLCPRST